MCNSTENNATARLFPLAQTAQTTLTPWTPSSKSACPNSACRYGSAQTGRDRDRRIASQVSILPKPSIYHQIPPQKTPVPISPGICNRRRIGVSLPGYQVDAYHPNRQNQPRSCLGLGYGNGTGTELGHAPQLKTAAKNGTCDAVGLSLLLKT